MKLIKPYIEILDQKESLDGIYKMIECAGRTCYKSESNITPDSSKEFVDRMIKSGHYSMLEHGTVYLHICNGLWSEVEKYINNKYSKVEYKLYRTYDPNCFGEDFDAYITTNYRVLVENGWLADLKYLCEPTEYHKRRATVKFVSDRGIWNEFIRHRTLQRVDDCGSFLVDYDAETKFSFAQESTRFCNYSAYRFDNELTFIIPSNLPNLEEGRYEETTLVHKGNKESIEAIKVIKCIEGIKAWNVQSSQEGSFLESCLSCEEKYFEMLNKFSWSPQQARDVLPNALKTELVMTGFISDWVHFLNLRHEGTTGAPHPDAKVLAGQVREEFIKRGYIES